MRLQAMTYPWHYDETVALNIDFHDPKEVKTYDERMGRLRDLAVEAEEIAEDLALSPDSTVWEIGTGTGECSLALASRCRQVYATDVSRAMLAYARKKAEERQVRNVVFEVGGFLSGFQPECSVNGVVSQLALHHLPDFWKSRAFKVMAGKLLPKGRLYLRDAVFPSDVDDYDSFFAQAVEDLRAKAGDEMARRKIQHIRKEYSTLDWILEGMMERNGLKIVKKESKGFLTVYVCEK